MKFRLDVYFHHEGEHSLLEEIKLLKQLIISNHTITMATAAQFKEAIDEMKLSIDNIAADIEKLSTTLGGDLTPAEEDAALAELTSLATRLREIAAITPE